MALLVPQPLATEIEGIRRACGDPRRGRIAPHITLVPPVNVAAEQVSDALEVVRLAGAQTGPLHLVFGAPSTFAPTTPLAWLSVGGDVGSLADLRGRLDRAPWARPTGRSFVPHVTVSAKLDEARLQATLLALADFEAAVTIDRVHVLENRQLGDGRWGWQPLVDAPLGRRRAVVGSGGLEVELSISERVDPDARLLMSASERRSGRGLAVTARRDGMAVGVGWGTVDPPVVRLDGLVVAPEHERQGIGSHVLARFVAEAVDRGCDLAVHAGSEGTPLWSLCRRRGWTAEVPDHAPHPVLLVRTLGLDGSAEGSSALDV